MRGGAGLTRIAWGEAMLKLGLSTAAYYGRYETEEAGALMASMPLDCCEVFLECAAEYTAAFGAEVKRALGGLPARSVHPKGTQFEDGLFGRSARQRAEALRTFEGVLAAGRALGADAYVFHGMPDLHRRGAGPNMQAHAHTVRALCARARDYGMRLAWENVWWCQMSRPEHVALVREAAPEARFVLDVKQALHIGIDPLDFLPAMGERLLNVHVCDVDAAGALCLPGRGVFDFAAFFRALRDHGYDGPVILEPYAHLFERQDEIEDALAALRAAMERAD